MSPVIEVLILLFMTKYGVSVELMYLGTLPRLGDFTHFDYFYKCRSCGQSLQWQVDGVDAASHFATDNIGQTRFRANSSGNDIIYLSMLLSSSITNNEVCLTALLLVSRSSMVDLDVLCRGDSEQQRVNNFMTITAYNSTKRGSVQIDYLISNDSIIVLPGVEYTTRIFMCNVNGTSLTWMVNGESSGGFVAHNKIGTSAIRRHLTNDAVVYTEAALITNEPLIKTLTSVLVLSENSSIRQFTISCRSDITELIFNVMDQEVSEPQETTDVVLPTFIVISTIENLVYSSLLQNFYTSDTTVSQADATLPVIVTIIAIIFPVIFIIAAIFIVVIILFVWKKRRRQVIDKKNSEYSDLHIISKDGTNPDLYHSNFPSDMEKPVHNEELEDSVLVKYDARDEAVQKQSSHSFERSDERSEESYL